MDARQTCRTPSRTRSGTRRAPSTASAWPRGAVARFGVASAVESSAESATPSREGRREGGAWALYVGGSARILSLVVCLASTAPRLSPTSGSSRWTRSARPSRRCVDDVSRATRATRTTRGLLARTCHGGREGIARAWGDHRTSRVCRVCFVARPDISERDTRARLMCARCALGRPADAALRYTGTQPPGDRRSATPQMTPRRLRLAAFVLRGCGSFFKSPSCIAMP